MAVNLSAPQLGKTIRALVDKGDKAADKAEQFYKAAGLHLKPLKEQKPDGVTWAEFAQETCELSRRRADELIQIADGRTTLEAVRENKRASVRKIREKQAALRSADVAKFLGPRLKDIEAKIDPIWRTLTEFERLTRERPIEQFIQELDPREGIDVEVLEEMIRARDWLSALIENMRESVESCST